LAARDLVMTPRISLRGAGKTFHARGKAVVALEPVSLDIASEQFVAIVGPSGCGKSTILNLIAGLVRPSEGSVIYDGREVVGANTRVGYMTQKDTLLPWRTAESNVALALELDIRRRLRGERKQRVAQLIELVGLTGFEHHYPAELSGGMRKRAALARTLVYEPETLLMDEPFGALDAQLRLVMMNELQRITQLRKVTVVFVTHDLGEAIALADRVVVMSARPGRIRHVRDIPLPRPRNVFELRFTKEFASLHEALWEELKDEVAKGSDN
jgi:NitT/TauT family transport system ATP-binding protein